MSNMSNMSSYRQPAPPSASLIKLETHDQQKLLIALLAVIGVTVIGGPVAFMVVRLLAPADAWPLVMGGLFLVMGVGFVVGFLLVIKSLRELRFLLEVSDAGIRLLRPNKVPVADTASRTLSFVRVTYTRRGRHGSAWTRPGWRMLHPGGDHLVGTLLPEPPWEGAPHDPRTPEFELRAPELALLDDRLRRG
jgi:hypothetical protein